MIKIEWFQDGDTVAECSFCYQSLGFSDADVPGENGPVAVGMFQPYVVVSVLMATGAPTGSTDTLCPICACWVKDVGTALSTGVPAGVL